MAELIPSTTSIPEAATQPSTTPISTNSLLSQVNNPQAVYSAPNISQSVTNPVVRPNLSDPFGLYESYMNSADIQAARNSVNESNKELLGVRQTARTQNQAIGNLAQSMNVIRGEQATAGDQANLRLQAAGENLTANQSLLDSLTNVATNKYNIALTERENLQKLIASAPGAKISYADSYETAVSKADKYLKEQEKEAKKEAYKDELKKTALSLGLKIKGSTGDIENRLKKYYKEQGATKKELDALDMAIKKKSLSGGTAAGANSELAATAKAFTQFKGDWGKTADYLASQGYDVSSGSTIDNELRRRNGLAPIVTGKTGGSLTPAQKTAIADFDSTIDAAKSAKEMAKTVNTGFIAGNIGKVGQKVGMASQNFVALNSKIALIKSNFMKALAGANVTASEKTRLEQFLPDTSDSEETLQTKIDNFIQELESQKANLEIQGGGTGEIKVRRKQDGAEGYIPANEFNSSEYIKV